MSKFNYNKAKLKSQLSAQYRKQKEDQRLKVAKNSPPATRAQKEYMRFLGIPIPKNCTKHQASSLISFHLGTK